MEDFMEVQNEKDHNSDEYMKNLSKMMTEAFDSTEGMKALAAAIGPPISLEIKKKEVTSLLLTEHVLPVGESAKYVIRPTVKAHWISKNGEAMTSDVEGDETEFPVHRIHALPMIDIMTLKHGNIGTLLDIQKAAANEIRKEIDKRTIKVILNSVLPENTVTVTGGVLTEEAINEAISLIEDKELTAKMIVMRGKRFKDLKGWDLDPVGKTELRQKGIIKNYGTANIMLTSTMPENEILILPDEEIGKFPIREKLTTDTITEKRRFRTGWLAWMEVGHGILRPDIITKVVVQP